MRRLALLAALFLLAVVMHQPRSARALSFPGIVTATTCGNISLSLAPSRGSGDAPLAVQFNATGTTDSGVTTDPFHDLQYVWSFGDAAGGATWANGTGYNNSKNAAMGPIVGHVFETPSGTDYTVTLTVTDASGSVCSTTQAITVTDPDTTFATTATTCVRQAATGTFTGCPSGAIQVTQASFVTAISTYATAGRRVLFRKGDTWAPSTTATLLGGTKGYIGAFGSGAIPKIASTQSGSGDGIFQIADDQFGHTNPAVSDWRIVDLELDGTGTTGMIGITFNGNANQITFLRVNIHDFPKGGMQASEDVNNSFTSAAYWDQIAIADSTFQHFNGGSGVVGLYLAMQNFMMVGSLASDTSTGEHVFRSQYLKNFYVASNTYSTAATGKHVFTLRAPCLSGSSGCTVLGAPLWGGTIYSEIGVMNNNKFIAGALPGTILALHPENSTSDERIRTIIVENNWIVPGASTRTDLEISGVDVTARNNLFDQTGGDTSSVSMVAVQRRGIEPVPNNTHLYNNTFSTTAAWTANNGNAIQLDANQTNTVIKNNLGYGPNINASGNAFISGTASSTASNSSTAQFRTTNPNFTVQPPVNPADWKPTSGYAIGGGTAPLGGVLKDFFNVAQPNPTDIGAVVH